MNKHGFLYVCREVHATSHCLLPSWVKTECSGFNVVPFFGGTAPTIVFYYWVLNYILCSQVACENFYVCKLYFCFVYFLLGISPASKFAGEIPKRKYTLFVFDREPRGEFRPRQTRHCLGR